MKGEHDCEVLAPPGAFHDNLPDAADRRPSRVHYIDWMRILAVLLLFPFHTARLFDVWEPNYVKNDALSPLLSYQNAFLWTWHMPLFFLLAGASSWYALSVRGGGGYLRERGRRLFIPLMFGLLVIVPPQAYFARFQEPGYADSYLDFLRDYFIIRGNLTGYTGLFTPAHLWFVLYLFVFSLVGLPLFLWLKRDNRLTNLLVKCCAARGVLFLLAIPLGVAGALPGIGGKNPFFYFLVFVYGFLLFSDERCIACIDRNKRTALILGLITMSITMTLWVLRVNFPLKSAQDILFYSLRTFNTWFWLLLLLGYGRIFLNGANRLKRYASEAAYPVYMLHQTVIVLLGYYVVQWNASVWTKYIATLLASFVVTLFVYDIFVRRVNVARLLFGMTPLRKNVCPNVTV